MLSRDTSTPHDSDAVKADRRGHARLSNSFERRQLTVMFCDLVDSTSLALETDPEDLNEAFGQFYLAITESITEFGGFVARYVGDGVLVYFGYPHAQEDDAERAVQAALTALASVKSRGRAGRTMQARIGITTGVVVVGNLHATNLPTTFDIAGEAAHVAARLQGTALPDTILVTAATRAVVGEFFDWRPLGARTLKGIAQPVDVWQVLGTRPVPSRFEALRGADLSPMLARDGERSALITAWQGAVAGRGNAVVIHGESGIGKSRLAASIVDDAVRNVGTILRLSCSPTHQGSVLHPSIVFLQDAAGIARGDAEAVKLAKLSALLLEAEAEDVSLIAELLSLKQDVPGSLAHLSPRARRVRTMQALLSQLERASQQRPVLIVFEDAHWSDESSRLLLEWLVERIVRLPMLLLVLTRPGYQPEWTTKAHVTQMHLTPLTPDVSAALVHFIAASHPLSPRLVSSIVERTDGFPLFIEEVTKAVVEDETSSAPSSNGVENDLPPFSLQGSLLARLDRLGRAREIAQVASAIGREFSAELLRLVSDFDHDIDQLLDSLVESQIVMRSGRSTSTYIFKHALIRDSAHALMNRDKRHAVHMRIAAALEAHYPEVALNSAEVLAWHYTEARVFEKAVGFWLLAGQQCLRRSAMDEALRHLHQGESLVVQVEVSPRRRQVELDMAVAIGMAQIATQGYAVTSTGDTFRRAHALCAHLSDPPQTLAVMHGLWTHALMRADFPAALAQVDEVFARGAERSDPIWTLMGYRFRGSTRYFLGEFGETIADADACLELYDPAKRARYASYTVDDPGVVMLLYRAWSLMCMGHFTDAADCCERALNEARQIAHVYTLTHALCGRAFVTLTVGSAEDALRQLDELLETLADNGIAYYDAVERILRGSCLALLGRVDEGLAMNAEGLAAYRSAGTALYVPGFLRMAAESHCRAGKTRAAAELVHEAVVVMNRTGQCWDAAEIHRVCGVIELAGRDEIAAENSFRHAIRIARSQGAMLWELRATRDLAGLLELQGQDESERLLSDIASPTRHRRLADLARAKEILSAVV